MRIKMITFAPHPNFGTCLQSYALNYELRKMGHDVEFIYNCRETPPVTFAKKAMGFADMTAKKLLPGGAYGWLKAKRRKKRDSAGVPGEPRPHILELPDRRLLCLASKLPGYNALFKRSKCKNLQWEKVYKFTYEEGSFNMRRIYTHRQYEKLADDTDLFITGSDQIWNPYCGGFNPMMFVEFCDGVKKVSYSSSISQPRLPKELEGRIREDLLKFSHIAVREQRSVEILDELLGRDDVKLVVDPTYLLTAEEWTEFGSKAVLEFEVPEHYIFCYFVGDERKDVYERMVQEAKELTGINDVITLECYGRDLNYGGGRLYKDAGPREWVYLLQHSDYVCADSFHATAFALKFRKEFVLAMKNEEDEAGSQNTRMHDILGRYGLEFKDYGQGEGKGWQKKIDYSKVTPIIEAEIEDSLEFLKFEVEK